MPSINVVIIIFFILLTILSSITLPKEKRWIGILVISVVMYYLLVGHKVLVILYLGILTYYLGKGIYKQKIGLVVPVLLLLVPLIVSKSLETQGHFDTYTLGAREGNDQQIWKIILQILGLSYITFNCLSYLIDIHKRYIKPEQNFLKLMLYVFFFPIVFSGPLHRYKYLSRQFENISVSNKSISMGGRLILFGLLKMMVSQRFFVLVITLDGTNLKGPGYLIIGTLFFLFLYLSFSSFIDIFIGVSKILNIELKRNFKNRIYLSSSRQEFWSGWHITLNEWFRDYFFFPLVKRDKRKRYLDWYLMLTFLLIAVWHGFTLSLVIWGLANGTWIVLEKKASFKLNINQKLKSFLGIIYHLTFSSLLSLVFISTNLKDLAIRLSSPPEFTYATFSSLLSNLMTTVVCFGIIDYHYARSSDQTFDIYMENKSTIARWFIYLKFAFLIMLIGNDLSLDNYYNQF